MAKVELKHDQKDLVSYKEQTRTDGRRIRELEEKMKDMECKFEADKALMERDFHISQLETADTAFERGCQAMMSLFTEATHEFDGEKGVFLPD